MKKMSKAEAYEFLAKGTRTGKLATVREDGRPHVAPIWFVLDGDDLIFNTWHESVKGKNLVRDGRIALTVDEEVAPYAFVIVEGTVEITENDPAESLKWATRIGARYMGEDQAEAFGKRNSVPGELLLRIKVDKIVAQKDLAAW
ncbi:MAG: PPOX class F420-dependent oxidoreductase [Ardenticatenaceae bacterium]|nr:PPOX class F420-dependent oxidoreductase [Ardenticatenaceae bacterium]MCB8949296.1 PPOX class F420-dependent oxidoreductase [Ardenticatenaceae bacterium]